MKQVSIDNLNECSVQEVFDFIANHLLTQGERCIDKKGLCKYRLGNLTCAAGCLIPEEKYKPEFEGDSWNDLVMNFNFPDKHIELIIALQELHDQCLPGYWKKSLYKMAEEEELSIAILEKF